FYQCDVDIIGSTSLLNEAALVEITDEVFGKIGIAIPMNINHRKLLSAIAVLAVACCLGTIYGHGAFGVYCLMGISGCMSLMFPTIYGMGTKGLGEDIKLGGSGMVMAIAGAALLTQIQGIVSDQAGSIALAYWVPLIAFAIIAYYGMMVCRKYNA
ncbi:MAG: hypothetical protein MJY56_02345, partial [Bacteroidales bacterium]|nr:hypothetical protein [Bacteroidales bacterium]